MKKVIIFGTGQISELAHFYISRDTDHQIAAFTVHRDYLNTETYKDLPVVAYEELKEFYPPGDYALFIPISFKGVNQVRRDVFEESKRNGYGFITYISPKATYYDTPVGDNCFIMEDNTIQPFTEIGDNVILWSGNHIGHHSKIESHCFITSHVVVSGAVVVGEGSFLGVNSTIRDNVRIGKQCVIGAGSTISRSLDDYTVTKPEKVIISPIKSTDLRGI